MLGKSRDTYKHRKAHSGRSLNPEKDYRVYTMGIMDYLYCGLVSLAICGLVAWLFYRSVYGMVVFPLVGYVLYLQRKKSQREKQQATLRRQFNECIRVVTASLYSGYSVENAFAEAEKELRLLLGEQEPICRELHVMNKQIRLNVSVESLLENLARRSGVEEIQNFGQVFSYAKRNGSDFARILKDTSARITEKEELEREIAMVISAKKLEQKVMNVIPLGILLLVELTSPGFLDVMYQGLLGRCIMTLCLVIYAIAYGVSQKIVDIQI